MVEKLTVIFFIILCLLLGFYLILSPWDMMFGRWNENYLLVFLTDISGLAEIRTYVSSNWVRGAVTGFGVLNLIIGFWEIANFKKNVDLLNSANKSNSE